jgi:glycosyltransferase involved in cell wall biosynthesis
MCVPATCIAVSKGQQKRMMRVRTAEDGKVKLVANHIDESELKQNHRKDRQTVRGEIGLQETAIVVCQPARLDRQKNPLFLIRVAALTRVQFPNLVFMLMGEGPLKKKVIQEINRQNLQETVRLMGYRPDALDLLGASDIVTLTSLWEGLPYALLEAVCLKKPVVATDVRGNQDLVVHGCSGYLSKTEDEFAAALGRLAQSKSLRDKMGKYGYDRQKDLFDLTHLAHLMAPVYGELP